MARRLGLKPHKANLIKASGQRVYFVPEGLCDRSLARSAWESVRRANRPVGYGMIERSHTQRFLPVKDVCRVAIDFGFEVPFSQSWCADLPDSYRTLRDGSLGGAVPGTSCQATIAHSLRDKSHSSIEGTHLKLVPIALKAWAESSRSFGRKNIPNGPFLRAIQPKGLFQMIPASNAATRSFPVGPFGRPTRSSS
jgi:hypothetical protein